MPTTGERLCECRLFHAHMRGDRDEVFGGNRQELGESAFARRHRQDLPVGAQIVAPRPACIALTAGHKRIDRDARTASGTLDNCPDGFMSKNQWGRTPFIVAKIGVHVRATDAAHRHFDESFIAAGSRTIDIAQLERLWPGIDQRLHLAVNPPST